MIDQPLAREAIEATFRGRFLFSERKQIVERQDCLCAKCGDPITPGTIDHQIDHIIPLELGGAHHTDNAQALCIACHKVKTCKDIRAIRKAQRLERDANPETRRKSPHRLRGRGFQKDPLR
jgi:5-methylcytosine-specific restriction endonuclease McrA